MDKQKWSLVGSAGLGAGVGAGLMYLLDPEGGRSRRALARDKSLSALKQGGKAAAKTSRHLGNKTKGLVAEAGSKLRKSDLADDGQKLLKKVQKAVRASVSHPSAIDPILENGRVYLHGLVLASEVALLLSAIGAVEGVTDVENRLEVHESPKDLAAFRKGAKRWVGPATRVLTGTTGSALTLAGLRKKNGLGVALGAVGLGLLAHGLANPDVKQLAGKLRRSRNGSTGEERSAGLEETAHRHQLEDAYQPVS
jgi:gas vesicle protein